MKSNCVICGEPAFEGELYCNYCLSSHQPSIQTCNDAKPCFKILKGSSKPCFKILEGNPDYISGTPAGATGCQPAFPRARVTPYTRDAHLSRPPRTYVPRGTLTYSVILSVKEHSCNIATLGLELPYA